MTEEIRWETPAPAKAGRGSTKTEFYDALRQRPGQWAVYGASLRSGGAPVSRIKKGLFKGGAPGQFDAVSRLNRDGTFTVYARYIGD